ncbi:6244_t:CDS:2 [Acaulospora colombiana]|uniref:6244_t:CDS:1 n=1 Tax=Acaulospora colombiana TaxID=27376 RepID=A0ACA9KGA9_9GLOM|nr:6244_t:CDS:2 [Acaulospora colombiana]
MTTDSTSNITYLSIGISQGSAGNMGHRLPIAERFYKDFRCNVILLSYRGYGHSEGTPSEKGIRMDTQAILDYIKQDPSLKDTKLIIYGQSLGGSEICIKQGRTDGHKLINTIELPIQQRIISHVAPKFRYISFICSEIWPSDKSIVRIKSIPILFISGTKDEIIPPRQMRTLYELAATTGRKEWKEVIGGSHYDTVTKPEYFEIIGEFLRKENLGV